MASSRYPLASSRIGGTLDGLLTPANTTGYQWLLVYHVKPRFKEMVERYIPDWRPQLLLYFMAPSHALPLRCAYRASVVVTTLPPYGRGSIYNFRSAISCAIRYLAMGVYYEQRKALGFDHIPSATETPILKR